MTAADYIHGCRYRYLIDKGVKTVGEPQSLLVYADGAQIVGLLQMQP